MKTALVISPYYLPLSSIAAFRIDAVCKYFIENDFYVNILCDDWGPIQANSPNLEVIQVKIPRFLRGRSLRKAAVKVESGSDFQKKLFANLFAFRERHGIFRTARMPDYYDFWVLDALRAVRGEHFDLVFSSSGPYASHLVALALKEQKRAKKWIADYRDLWVDNHIYSGLYPFVFVEKLLENMVNKNADYITVVSEAQKSILSRKGFEHKIITVMNGYEKLPPRNERRNQHDSKVRLVYTGTIYDGFQDITPLFEAVLRISSSKESYLLDNLEILIAGDVRTNIKKEISRYNVGKWVRPIGIVPHDTAIEMQRNADILIFLAWDKDPTVMTGKVFEYISSGTFIWSIGGKPDDIPTSLIVSLKCGIAMGKDAGRIEHHLRELLITNIIPRTEVSDRILESFSRKQQLSHLDDVVKSI